MLTPDSLTVSEKYRSQQKLVCKTIEEYGYSSGQSHDPYLLEVMKTKLFIIIPYDATIASLQQQDDGLVLRIHDHDQTKKLTTLAQDIGGLLQIPISVRAKRRLWFDADVAYFSPSSESASQPVG